MKRMPYVRPTDYYDERIKDIDEALCRLLRQRKEVSANNPGYPPFEYIAEWAASNDLYDDYLKALFGLLMNEESLHPVVDPAGFRKNVLVSKTVEIGDHVFSLPVIQQYANASVVCFSVNWEASEYTPGERPEKVKHYQLFLGEHYTCRMSTGSGSSGHFAYRFVVTPPLPDDLSGIEFRFQPSESAFRQSPSGQDIRIRL